jgi:hypothetical protein
MRWTTVRDIISMKMLWMNFAAESWLRLTSDDSSIRGRLSFLFSKLIPVSRSSETESSLLTSIFSVGLGFSLISWPILSSTLVFVIEDFAVIVITSAHLLRFSFVHHAQIIQ